MKPAALAAALAAVTLAVICARLGFWQLARFDAARQRNAAQARALAAPPRTIADGAGLAQLRPGARVRLIGRFEPSEHVLLSARLHAGEPGVELVSALRLAGGSEAVVVRGWLPAADARSATPPPAAATPDSIDAIAESLGTARVGTGWTPIGSTGSQLWSAFALDADTLRRRWPGALATLVFRALPSRPAAGGVLPRAPDRVNDGMHLGYAIQWFAFALVLAGGGAFFAVRARRAVTPGA